MATQQAVIKKFMYSLDKTSKKGEEALDEAIKYATDGKYSKIQKVIDDMKKDVKAANSSDKFLKDYCGIDLSNTDTGAITGSDAGGSKVKTAKSIVPESGSIDTTYEYNSIYVEKYDITFYLSEIDANGYVKQNFVSGVEFPSLDFKNLTPAQKYIWQGLNSQWAEKALDLIAESYGSNFGFDSSTLIKPKKIYFGFYDRNDSSMAESGPLAYNDNSTKEDTTALVFRVNMNKFDSINTSDPNGSNNSGDYIDRTIAHELTHCVMAANIKYYTALPQFVKEGLAELTIGADDGALNQSWMKTLASKSSLSTTGSNESLFDTALDLSNTASSQASAYAGGNMFFRYLARQTGDLTITNSTAKKIIQTFNGNDSINNTGSNVTIYSGAGNDYIVNTRRGAAFSLAGSYSYIDAGEGNDYIENREWADYSRVLGGAGKDTILNRAANSTIFGGANNDSIQNITSNVSINGGDGNDIIIDNGANGNDNTINGGKGDDTINLGSTVVRDFIQYNAGDGNDLITNFASTDTLSISGGSFSSIKSGTNYIFTVGEGKITLQGAASLSAVNVSGVYENPLLITGTSGADSISKNIDKATIQALGGNDSVWNYSDNVSINASNGNDHIDNRGNKVTILGGKGNDTLRNDTNNGKANNVKLSGNSGKDILSNWGNKVTMLGGSGNDSLYNYKNGGGGENVSIDGGADNDVIVNYGIKSTLSGGDGKDKLYGQAGNDILRGDSGNDSLWGGAGNDTLWGGDGKDTFIYTANEGTDRIMDFESGDILQILKTDGSNGSFKSSKYSGGNLTLTINGGGKVIFDDVSKSDTFNINSTTYKISGSKLVK